MTWIFSQKKEITQLKKMKAGASKLSLAGDGRFDSPGFCAKLCTYSIQSLQSKKIIALWVAAKHVVKSSATMEPYAAKTLLNDLLYAHSLHFDSITTDRSLTMKAMLSEFNDELPANIPKFLHLYDVWHWIKSVVKDLHNAAKLKSCAELSDWIPSIQNQLWWTFSTSIGNREALEEKILSITLLYMYVMYMNLNTISITRDVHTNL